MKKINRIATICGMLIAFHIVLTSCHALLDDDAKTIDAIPVLNGYLYSDSAIKVQLSWLANVGAKKIAYIQNAQVTITDTLGKIDTLQYSSQGWYTTTQIAKAGMQYVCKANVANHAEIYAKTTIPLPTVLDSVLWFDFVERGSEGEKVSAIKFKLANMFISTEKYTSISLQKYTNLICFTTPC